MTTQEDPVNPFLTTVVCEGIVVARAGYSNKKMSRQVAARKALSILAPLLDVKNENLDEGDTTVTLTLMGKLYKDDDRVDVNGLQLVS